MSGATPDVCDLVAGMDEYGRAVAGEVISVGGGYVHIQPHAELQAGVWSKPSPVQVRGETCSVTERAASRAESFAQRDRRIAEVSELFARMADRSRSKEIRR